MTKEAYEIYEREKITEKCGVFGILKKGDAPLRARIGIAELEHRGQDAAAVAMLTDGKIWSYGGTGPVDSISLTTIGMIEADVALAHCRYRTSGEAKPCNIQPICISDGKFSIGIAHNGNIPNEERILEFLKEKPRADSDTSYLSHYLLQQRPLYNSWEETFVEELPKIEGAYALAIATEEGRLYGVLDGNGIPPLCVGKIYGEDKGWIIASEHPAILAAGGEFVRHVKRGEIFVVEKDGSVYSRFFGKPTEGSPCSFQKIYFKRGDSYAEQGRITSLRRKAGELVWDRLQEKGFAPDVIVPVLQSGYDAAFGLSEVSGAPLITAIQKNITSSRTFIQGTDEMRRKAVRGKHSVNPDDVQDRIVAVVDDSVVRATTAESIVEKLYEAGASEVHFISASPPVVNNCNLGISMEKKDLIAAPFRGRSLREIEEKVAERIGAKSMTYLSVEGLAKSMGVDKRHMCAFCLGEEHPLEKNHQFEKLHREYKKEISIYASGSGTNFDNLANHSKEGKIPAKISLLVCNKPENVNFPKDPEEAGVIQKAYNHGINVAKIDSRGRMKGEKRNQFQREILEEMIKEKPDLIVLAGWMVVLDKRFLEELQELRIPIINLHPGLLTPGNDEFVMTSKGKVPVIRGAHAINDAWEQKPATLGVTVHQVLPGEEGSYDVGPIVMKAEVPLFENDTLETLEKRVHEVEYELLPAAVNYVLHVISHGIDISKGDFPW